MMKKHSWIIVIFAFIIIAILLIAYFYSLSRDSRNVIKWTWGLQLPKELHLEDSYTTTTGPHGEASKIYVFSYEDVDAINRYYQGQFRDTIGNLESSYIKEVQNLISTEEAMKVTFQFLKTTKCEWLNSGGRKLLIVWDELSKRIVLFEDF